MSKPMTLQDFAEQILEPSVLRAVKSGHVDNALFDPDVQSIEFSPQVQAAIAERLQIIAKKKPTLAGQ